MGNRLYNTKLYNLFMDLIGKCSNEELEELAKSLIEYVKEDV